MSKQPESVWVAKVTRALMIGCTPLLLASLYHFYNIQRLWLAVFPIIAFAVILISGWQGQFPRHSYAQHSYARHSYALWAILLLYFPLVLDTHLVTRVLFFGWGGLVLVLWAWSWFRLFRLAMPGIADTSQEVAPSVDDVATQDELEAQNAHLTERVRVLQDANLSFQRRAMYLEASVQISQALSTLFEVEPLLEQAVNLITETYKFYHTGIFLLDETGEGAVLRAASSSGGRKMLARGHKLRKGPDSMVGWVMEQREPRIAADVGEDAVHFATPELPATRSELALPLILRRGLTEQLIGVLDVQSTEESAFSQDDIRTLQGLAGQLAVAIHNAQRLSEEATLLEATSPFYRLARRLATTRSNDEIYHAILATIQDFGPSRAFIFRWTGDQNPISTVAEMRLGEVLTREARETSLADLDVVLSFCRNLESPLLISDESTVTGVGSSQRQAIASLEQQLEARSLALVPIPVAEAEFNLLVVFYNVPHQFSGVETQLYRVLADQAAVTLQRFRLLDEAQARADRERLAAEISAHVRASAMDVDQVLQSTIRELGRALHATGTIRLGSPENVRRDSDRAAISDRAERDSDRAERDSDRAERDSDRAERDSDRAASRFTHEDGS